MDEPCGLVHVLVDTGGGFGEVVAGDARRGILHNTVVKVGGLRPHLVQHFAGLVVFVVGGDVEVGDGGLVDASDGAVGVEAHELGATGDRRGQVLCCPVARR